MDRFARPCDVMPGQLVVEFRLDPSLPFNGSNTWSGLQAEAPAIEVTSSPEPSTSNTTTAGSTTVSTTALPLPSASANPKATESSKSNDTAVGIGVGLTAIIIVCAIIIYVAVWRRKNSQKLLVATTSPRQLLADAMSSFHANLNIVSSDRTATSQGLDLLQPSTMDRFAELQTTSQSDPIIARA